MAAKRCIITIGREYGSGGREIGEKLAEKLGFSFYDRNLLNLAAEQSGISEEQFSEKDERAERRYFSYGMQNLSEALFHFQSKIMLEKAKKESCVIVGRCSDVILKGYAHSIHIFIYADEEDKILRIRERNNLDEIKARKLMRQTEKIRSSYYQYYTDTDWGARENKDLLINSSKTGIDGAVELIISYLKIRGLID